MSSKGATAAVTRNYKRTRGTPGTGDGLEASVIRNTVLILIHALPDPNQLREISWQARLGGAEQGGHEGHEDERPETHADRRLDSIVSAT